MGLCSWRGIDRDLFNIHVVFVFGLFWIAETWKSGRGKSGYGKTGSGKAVTTKEIFLQNKYITK